MNASGNNIGQSGGEALVQAMQSNTSIADLVLGSKDKPAAIPLKQLRDNSINGLDYSGKELLAEGGIVLAFALKSNSSVTKVSERHCSSRTLLVVALYVDDMLFRFAVKLHAVRALEHEYQAWTNLSAKLAVTLAVVILSVNLMWPFVVVFGVLGVQGCCCRA